MILGIDTSLGTELAVVEHDGVVCAVAASEDSLGHAEVIGSLLAEVLASEASGPRITHVASGMGPGPFTGLRIGIAAARTFAMARGIPVVAVPSHDAVALDVLTSAAIVGEEPGIFAVVTDARRREFAYTVYDGLDDDGLPVRVHDAALTPRDQIDDVLQRLGARRHDATRVPAPFLALAAARAVAASRILTGDEPLYLRSPDVTVGHVRKRVGT